MKRKPNHPIKNCKVLVFGSYVVFVGCETKKNQLLLLHDILCYSKHKLMKMMSYLTALLLASRS